MKDYSPKQTAAMKARVRRLRAQYRKRMIAAVIIFFILGLVAGIFAYRWYASKSADLVEKAAPAVTAKVEEEVTPEPVQTPDAWAMPEDDGEPSGDGELIFPEDEEPQADTGAELDAFPEVQPETDTEAEPAPDEGGAEAQAQSNEAAAEPEAGQEAETEPEAESEPQAKPEGEAVAETGSPAPLAPVTASPEEGEAEAPAEGEAEPESDATAAPDMSSEDVPEYNPEEAEVPGDYLTVPDEHGVLEAEAGQALASYGPQVVAIVPFGESFTYTTEINADGNARVEATDAPYETISFTQTMKNFMRPTDFANKYSTQYKLQGDEAGAGFELILNDYTGEATIVPQNVIDVSLRSESGDAVERGYQLMDAEIAGNYGIALNTNTPKMLYKRYQYSDVGEEMAYLVVTTYKGGQTEMILFQLESDEPEPEPQVVYTTLQRGVKSDEVLMMQNRLIELGYLSGTVDGSFGPKTEEAIKSAQAAFGLEQTGIADAAFQQKLYEGAAVKPGQAAGYVPLSNGSVGDAVKRLQARLKELGYYTGRIDGGYGPMMEAAVKKAQAAFGLAETGVADSDFQQRVFAGTQTEEADGSSEAESAAAEDPNTLKNGDTGDAVVRLQMALREQGFYTGRADGGYGPNTVACVKKAQAAFGMEQTGIADAAFQQRLFGTEEETSEAETSEVETPALPAGPAAEGTPLLPQQSVAAENTVG